jgi:thiamine transport system permease protein
VEISSNLVIKVIILIFPLSFLAFFFLLPLFKLLLIAFGLDLVDNPGFSFMFLFDVLSHPLNQYFLYWDVQQALVTTFFCLLLGLPGSYILAHYKFPLRSLLRNLLTVPFILPPIVVLIGFISAFGHGSWLNQVWSRLTGNILIDIYNSYEGIILVHVFYNIPVIIRLAEIGWKSIDPEIIAVAQSLNASKFRIFWKIQLPQLFPVLAAASLLVFIYAFNSFAIVLVLGGVSYQTLEVRIYSLALKSFEMNSAAALTLVQILINILFIIIYLYFSSKYEIPTIKSTYKTEKSLLPSPRSIKSYTRFCFSVGYFFILGMICFLPIVGVFTSSVFTSGDILSFTNYERLFNQNISEYIGLSPQNMVANTLLFGISVMILASLLAILLNYGLNYETTYKGTPKLTLLQSLSGIIVILPLAISSISLAFSLFSLYRSSLIYENVGLVIIIAQTLVAFPFANRIIAATRATIDPTLLNVARSLGASRFRTFMKIEFPLLLPGIIVAGLFSFAISIGEFGATAFLAKSNFATIPVGIYKLINTRNIGPATAFSTILIIVTVISFIIIEKFGRLEFRF